MTHFWPLGIYRKASRDNVRPVGPSPSKGAASNGSGAVEIGSDFTCLCIGDLMDEGRWIAERFLSLTGLPYLIFLRSLDGLEKVRRDNNVLYTRSLGRVPLGCASAQRALLRRLPSEVVCWN